MSILTWQLVIQELYVLAQALVALLLGGMLGWGKAVHGLACARICWSVWPRCCLSRSASF